jgi:ketosteroid isomerase-like protein
MSKYQLNGLIDGYLTAYAACDAQGCAAIFTADGALYSPYGPPAHGHAEIAATHVEWFAENEEDKTIEVTEYTRDQTTGHCLLRWSARVPDDAAAGGYHTASGHSLGILSFETGEPLFSRMALVPDPE